MHAELTSEEYNGWVKWLAYFHAFPNRNDILFGLLTSTVANQYSESTVRITDCMPYHDPYAEELTAEELAARIPF